MTPLQVSTSYSERELASFDLRCVRPGISSFKKAKVTKGLLAPKPCTITLSGLLMMKMMLLMMLNIILGYLISVPDTTILGNTGITWNGCAKVLHS